MKLNKEDKKLLLNWGYLNQDLNQIERATTKTAYFINDEKISTKKAIEILGREKYLSGVGRSAFHLTATRSNDDDNITIFFDSSKLFE